jgi:hypothetical protein
MRWLRGVAHTRLRALQSRVRSDAFQHQYISVDHAFVEWLTVGSIAAIESIRPGANKSIRRGDD